MCAETESATKTTLHLGYVGKKVLLGICIPWLDTSFPQHNIAAFPLKIFF
jgi:hypothetical protein